MSPPVLFWVGYVPCLCSGLLCLLAVSFWSARWHGGFSWDGSALQFNWHPVLMVAGLVVLYGNAVVLFRVPFTWRQKKLTWKLVHGSLMLLALLLSVLGLCAVFDNHRSSNIPDMYSLHSWVGICTVIMFAFQWLLGLAGFLLPCSPPRFRSNLKPVHVWMGKAILILSLTSCISGINEQLFFTLSGKPYNSLPAEAKFANSLGLLIVAFVLVVFGILSNDDWQRPETHHESAPVSMGDILLIILLSINTNRKRPFCFEMTKMFGHQPYLVYLRRTSWF
uniref:Lysosomal membrane ascorbate-dependent ferrireductase CYB561A3 n=1 Tax=Cyclopterus lumpus TaxID=8103 RepID=A0A8C3A2Z1_CYCLU